MSDHDVMVGPLARLADQLIAALHRGDIAEACRLADRMRRCSVDIDAVRSSFHSEWSRLCGKVREVELDRNNLLLQLRDAWAALDAATGTLPPGEP